MSKPFTPGVEFREVWKKFRRGEHHDSLRDLVPAAIARLRGHHSKADQLEEKDFWAIRDISFKVGPGDVLGIIGRNGAGKSTTLKVLTRILPPTLGISDIRGRVGALIEVSAGFHQDLTGRENVFLQGAIMGMRKVQIRRKFDEIVAFSGVEEFIDTPVKRYSSGMNARLGFSIAAHLDPDVLIIDEVLSVGDFEFQQRAFGRVKALATSGMPVVVVSHQLDQIVELCNQAIYMERGARVFQGDTHECVRAFLSQEDREADDADAAVRINSVRLVAGDVVRSGGPVQVRVEGHVLRGLTTGREVIEIFVRSLESGHELFAVTSESAAISLPSEGPFAITAELDLNLPSGLYGIGSSVIDRLSRERLAAGSSAHVQVTAGLPFRGTVQLNARVQLAPSGNGAAPSPSTPVHSFHG